MAKGDKYLGLKRYLQSSADYIVVLSYKDVEYIIDDKLPAYSFTRAIAWIDAGHKMIM